MAILKTKCKLCDACIELPDDVVNGEIVGCPDCGSEYEVTLTLDGDIELNPAELEGEDWGE